MPLSDIQCAFCNRHINMVFADGGRHVDTKYWREGNPRLYFCDGYCATGLHEKELKTVDKSNNSSIIVSNIKKSDNNERD